MTPWRPSRRSFLWLSLIALVVGGITAALVPAPTYPDAYYYFNAGKRLADGQGLTDPYIALTYIQAPDALPAPSHTYWMPLTSLLVALAGGSFRLSQAFFVGLWWGLVLLAFWLGARLGGTARHAWVAGLLAIFCGYYAPYLVITDTFSPFGLAGSLSLLMMGQGRARRSWWYFAAAGGLAALAHLTRADGLLLTGVLGLVVLWPSDTGDDIPARQRGLRWRLTCGLAGLAAYVGVMLPWAARNLAVMGTPLPVGGTATICLRGYNELVSYPPRMSLSNFLAWGFPAILSSRWEALTNNLGTFVAVEGLIVLAPLIVIALIRRWRHPFLLPVWLYAAALHLAMTFAFAYPGYRGGLFHSAAALLPWWMAIGLLGLDDVIDWVAKRRRTWKPQQAKLVFSAGVLVLAIALTGMAVGTRAGRQGGGPIVQVAESLLPSDAVVMSNDPAGLYFHTGLPGVVVPDNGPETIRLLAERYRLTHVLLDENQPAPLADLYAGRARVDFLQLVDQDIAPEVRLYAIVLP